MDGTTFGERLAARLEVEIGSRVIVQEDKLIIDVGTCVVRVNLLPFVAQGDSMDEIVQKIAEGLATAKGFDKYEQMDWPSLSKMLRMHLVHSDIDITNTLGGTISDSLKFVVAINEPDHLLFLPTAITKKLGRDASEIIDAAVYGTASHMSDWTWLGTEKYPICQFHGPEAADHAIMVALDEDEAILATPYSEIAWVVPETSQEAIMTLAKVSIAATQDAVGVHPLTPDIHVFRSGTLVGQIKLIKMNSEDAED